MYKIKNIFEIKNYRNKIGINLNFNIMTSISIHSFVTFLKLHTKK